MPLYEFSCSKCNQSFEELLRSSDDAGDVTCPRCGGKQVKRKLSTFASKVSGGGSLSFGGAPASSCSSGST